MLRPVAVPQIKKLADGRIVSLSLSASSPRDPRNPVIGGLSPRATSLSAWIATFSIPFETFDGISGFAAASASRAGSGATALSAQVAPVDVTGHGMKLLGAGNAPVSI